MPKIQTKGNEKNVEFLLSLLVQHIQSFHVLGAIEVYELLEKAPRGIERLEDNIKQDLLELLCYHNNEEEMDSDSFKMLDGMFLDEKSKTWSLDGLAERLYSEIVTSPQSNESLKDRARIAILCGKGRFHKANNDGSLTQGKQDKKGRVLQFREECKVSRTK